MAKKKATRAKRSDSTRTILDATPRAVTILPKLPERRPDAHKGDFGRVLVIGGSRGMIGAPSLTANAALRSGAGLVTIACPESIYQSVAVLCPCATTIPLPELPNGQLDPARAIEAIDASRMLGHPARPTAIAAGTGLGRGDVRFDAAWRELITEFSVHRRVPIVLDADGLNAMPTLDLNDAAPTAFDWSNLMLTPHPGEMARLCNTTAADVQSRRKEIVHAAVRKANDPLPGPQTDADAAGDDSVAQNAGCTILLKGAGTLVCDGTRVFTNTTGNSGMATGGSGDVLTGIIAAFIAQGMTNFDAAVLGANLHGKVGDMAAEELTKTSLIATDLLMFLPRVFWMTT